MTSRGVAASRVGVWQVALDRLELDVVRLERHLDEDRELRTDIWDVPHVPGPLPAALRERAEELLARQRHGLECLANRLGQAVRQQAVADAVSRTASSASGPVYVDLAV
jgi:hypothetical protein